MKSVKLTLSVDPKVVDAAKQYAGEQGTSVSQLVEQFLAAISSREEESRMTPILRRLRGSMRQVSLEDYQRHLAKKYQ